MKNAVGELEHVARLGFYQRIMNDELETCFAEVCGFIEKKYHIQLKERDSAHVPANMHEKSWGIIYLLTWL